MKEARCEVRRRLAVRAAGVLVVLVVVLTADARADVHVAIRPALSTVQPGQLFEVELTIIEAGAVFNGYDALMAYDPAAIVFMPRPQAQQEGPLMTEACPERFHVFEATVDTGELSLTHVLLCAGVSVAGPGVTYRLQFQAGDLDVTTSIRLLDDTAFYQAGTFVTPVHAADAVVQIGTGTGAPTPALSSDVRAVPNPFNPRTTIEFHAACPGSARVTVHDLRGMLVRTLWNGVVARGQHAVTWNGRDEVGTPLGSGVYIVCLELADEYTSTVVTLAR